MPSKEYGHFYLEIGEVYESGNPSRKRQDLKVVRAKFCGFL